MQKDFLSLEDLTPEELKGLLDETVKMKYHPAANKPLEGKSIALIFNKSSTRTRIGFEVGMFQLGGYAIMLREDETQIGRGESIYDTARVLSRYVDGLVLRTFDQKEMEEFAQAAAIPVINALTDKSHPCQAVTDYATILDKKDAIKGIRLTYIGDGNNVAHSLMMGGAMLGVDVTIVTPEKYRPDSKIVSDAKKYLKESGGKISISGNPQKAAKGADVIYTDVWASMGQEKEAKKRKKDFAGFTVDKDLLKLAKPDCLVMHCLPAKRGEEITAEVMDGTHSVVFDQAEYKLHAQKAILNMVLGD